MSNECNGLTGLIFGHKYQPRYNKGTPTMTKVQLMDQDVAGAIRAIEASKPTTYVHDVCARCGDIAGGAK